MCDHENEGFKCVFVLLVIIALVFWFSSNSSSERRRISYDTGGTGRKKCIRRDCWLSDWGEWSRCENPCDGYTFRSRYIELLAECGGTCYRLTDMQQPCNEFCTYDENMYNNLQEKCQCKYGYTGKCCECKKQDCMMSEWSDWTTCSESCGPFGKTNRSRDIGMNSQCGGSKCPSKVQKEACNLHCLNGGSIDSQDNPGHCTCQPGFSGECCDCKVRDCIMSEWSDWTTCSESCGPFGTTTRSRDIRIYPQCGGGSTCPSHVETEACNRHCLNGGSLDPQDNPGHCTCQPGFSGECCDCKVQDCKMTEWGVWLDCEIKEGTRGVRYRTRTTDTPPKCNGAACSTDRRQSSVCNICLNNGKLKPSANVGLDSAVHSVDAKTQIVN